MDHGGPVEKAAQVGVELAEKMLGAGGDTILKEVRAAVDATDR
jgi:hypothetical protein